GRLNTTTWRNNNWQNSGGTRHSSEMAGNRRFVDAPTIHSPTAPSGTFEPDFSNVSELKLQSGSPLRKAGLYAELVSNPPPDSGHNGFTYLTSDTGSGDPGDPGEPREFITTPEAHGWSSGNSNAQNTAAFNAAIAEAAANAGSSSTGRGVVELVQNKTYTVVQNSNGSTSNQTACLTALSNVEIRTVGNPTRSSGNHAVIQWESWSGKTGMH